MALFGAVKSKALFHVAAHIGAYGAIFGAFSGVLLFFGADLPPFSSMTRARDIEKKIVAVETDLRGTISIVRDDVEVARQERSSINVTMIDILIFNWEQRLRDARDDLEKNPGSRSARDAVERAEKVLGRLRARQEKIAPTEFLTP